MSKKSKKEIPAISNAWFFNKYLLCLIFFLVWMLIFDRHSWRTQRQLSRSIDALTIEKNDFTDKYNLALQQQKDLKKDPEKYARDNYFMHAENEQVFYIEKE